MSYTVYETVSWDFEKPKHPEHFIWCPAVHTQYVFKRLKWRNKMNTFIQQENNKLIKSDHKDSIYNYECCSFALCICQKILKKSITGFGINYI